MVQFVLGNVYRLVCENGFDGNLDGLENILGMTNNLNDEFFE